MTVNVDCALAGTAGQRCNAFGFAVAQNLQALPQLQVLARACFAGYIHS
jgi:hypothetical protein